MSTSLLIYKPRSRIHHHCYEIIRKSNSTTKPAITFGGINPAIFDKVSETMFTRYVLGLRVVSANTGKITFKMPYNKLLCGDDELQTVDTGAIGTLMDHSGGLCAWSTLSKPTQLVSTVDLRIDHIASVPCGESVLCDTEAVDCGDKFIRTDIKCWNESRTQLIAIGRGLFNIYMSPLSKMAISGAWMETVALALPSNTTASIVRLIEKFVVWRLQWFPRKSKKGEHHKHFRTNIRRSHFPTNANNTFELRSHQDSKHFQSNHHQHPIMQPGNEDSMSGHHHRHRDIVGSRRVAPESNHSRGHHSDATVVTQSQPENPGNETFEEFDALGELAPLGNDNIEKFVSACEMNNTFIRDALELRVVGAHPGLVIVSLPFRKRFIGNFFIPCLHGGLIAAVMKSAGSFATKSLIDSSKYRVMELNWKISYLKPAPCEELICEAEVVNIEEDGNYLVRMCSWDSGKKHKIASGSSTFRVYPL